MMTRENLEKTLLSLSNKDEYYGGSLGYLPFLLHAKWEHDNNVENSIAFSGDSFDVMQQLRSHYGNRDIGSLARPKIIMDMETRDDKRKIPEVPSDSLLDYAVKTIQELDLSEKNLKREDLSAAFNTYLNEMEEKRPWLNTRNKNLYAVTEDIIRKIAGDVEEVYDPFSSYGDTLSLVNAKKTHGTDPDAIKCLIAKIRMDFAGRTAEFRTVYSAEHPEITPNGTLRTYPLVVSVMDNIKFENATTLIKQDHYGRFVETVSLNEERNYLVEDWLYDAGIILGQALASTKDRCILFTELKGGSHICSSMNHQQFRSFIFSDVLEGVIQITKEIRRKGPFVTSSIYILNKHKDEKHKDKIFFVNADGETMSAEEIVRIYQNAEDIPGVSCMVPVTEISDNRHDRLSSIRYTAVLQMPESKNVSAILRNLRRLDRQNSAVMMDIMHAAHSLVREERNTMSEDIEVPRVSNLYKICERLER